jgi:hypothetical protein
MKDNMVKLKMCSLALACAVLAGCAANPAAAPAVAPVAGPVPLFAAGGFDAFELVTTPAGTMDRVLTARPDGVIAVAGNPSGYVATRASYTNYRLHAEWRWPGKPGNGGMLLHIQGGPKDRVWPLSLQVQTKNGAAGDLLPMAGASFTEPLSSAPGAATPIKAHTAADSERPAGAWNSMDVVCRDGSIEVAINGVAQNRVTGANPASGRIGIQLEGAPYELRNVTIIPLP